MATNLQVGVAFVCLALTAGLGTSAMIGLKFNPTTTRVCEYPCVNQLFDEV
jgi:hypothetical protein